MTPRAFQLTALRQYGRGHSSLSATRRVCTALGIDPETYAAYVAGTRPVPPDVVSHLVKNDGYKKTPPFNS